MRQTFLTLEKTKTPEEPWLPLTTSPPHCWRHERQDAQRNIEVYMLLIVFVYQEKFDKNSSKTFDLELLDPSI
jgi:hypothetical protein